jgi:hypothetical protein
MNPKQTKEQVLIITISRSSWENSKKYQLDCGDVRGRICCYNYTKQEVLNQLKELVEKL